MRREGDHLPRLVALGALEVLEQAESVAARQLDVEQDQRRALAAQRLEQPGAVRQADDAVPLEREQGGEELGCRPGLRRSGWWPLAALRPLDGLGKGEPERTAPAERRLDADRPALQLHESLAERQPQSRPLVAPARRGVDLHEFAEQLPLIPGVDPDA